MTAGYSRRNLVSAPVCRQYLRGHCNFGEECSYVHKAPRALTKPQPPPSPPDPDTKPHDLSQFKDVWEELLPPWATDRAYIMDCLTHGFPVVDTEPPRVPVLTRNYKSALEQCDAVEAQPQCPYWWTERRRRRRRRRLLHAFSLLLVDGGGVASSMP